MIFTTFLAAFLLSSVAGYYSIVGLTSIFVGAFWPIVIMGVSLEFGKLVTASWLYQNWKTSSILLRTYLTFAVIMLMVITSMGIFGFLAKSHIDSTQDKKTNGTELRTLNAQEKITQERLSYLLARAKDPSTASGYLDGQIQNAQKELTRLNKEKAILLKEENKQAVELGPLVYIADLFYDNSTDSLDKAVRLVIMAIMFVFDPLAVLLVIAGNILLKQKYPERFAIKKSAANQTKENEVIEEAKVKPAKETIDPVKKNEVIEEAKVKPPNEATVPAKESNQKMSEPPVPAPSAPLQQPLTSSPDKIKEQLATLLMTENDVLAAFKFFYSREPKSKDELKPYIGMNSKQLLDSFFSSREFLSRKGANSLVLNASKKLQGENKT